MSLKSRLVSGLRNSRPGEAEEQASFELSDDLAVQLVRSFEGQGSGWFWRTDPAGRLVYISQKVAGLLRADEAGPLGQPLTELLDMSGEVSGSERTLGFHLNSRTSFSNFEVRSARGPTDCIWCIWGRPVVDEAGQFAGFSGYGTDLSAERRSDAEIKRLALSDSLTGLANRARMRNQLDQMLSQLEISKRPIGLFMLDLDRFKAVNDTLGHQTGDQLLKIVAQRLERTVGQVGLVGRLGGDEFQVILTKFNNEAQLERLADAIILALSQPYVINGTNLSIGCSIGVALAPNHARDAETLVRNADLALYAAKAGGRANHRFFQPELLTQAQTRKAMEDDLRAALDGGQFRLVYQPVISTATKQISGYEALIRWDHPERGPVSPAEFIPIAEDSGLINSIGEWVLRTACAEAAEWPIPARIAVNVSPVQFTKSSLPVIVTHTLGQTGLDPDRLELEITEGVFLNGDETTARMLKTLKRAGVRLVLDDFGTGYSSLAYLKKAPFDKVKIDQSFVKGASHDPHNVAIIKAVVAIAETLKLETTAEGVETQDEIGLISELGCSHIQGFVYGKPVSASEVPAQLTESGEAKVLGRKTSRPPRQKLLRTATLQAAGAREPVRIRDISVRGLMFDGFKLALAREQPVEIEIVDGPTVRGVVRWTREGRAGVELAEPLNLEALAARPKRSSILRR
ncbi:MAG: putative bifunctional diguanylate cyclase/phosphodiesterase [Allosphingosinicella sp.]|uniref:putative bifunctional diguanylate cyclase/phosphodiesterase n=1 Tax=Allosphingosinicella sp. TaxID=2823234 RepID=UPI0039475603